MKLHDRNRGRVPILCCLLLAVAISAHAIPGSFSVSGVLKDAFGNPLPDATDVAVRIVFYDSEESADPLETVTTTCTILDGVFSARIEFPTSLLTLNQLWYTMAIDTDGNGLDANDVFAERFSVSSVPYSLSGQPVVFFNTHAGWVNGVSSAFTANRVYMSPFNTPPGGVEFDTVAFLSAGSSQRLVNIGIYDAEGTKVYETTPVIVWSPTSIPGTNALYYAVHLEGTLLPSSTYFVAVVTTSSDYGIFYSPQSIWPYPGLNDVFTTNATLPETVDPYTMKRSVAYNLTLIKSGAGKKRENVLSKLAGHSPEGYPIYLPVAEEEVTAP